MSIECCICSELILKSGIKVVTTICGHVHHSDCLKDWIKRNHDHGICPVCRTEFHPSKIIPLHTLDDNETRVLEGIYDYVRKIKEKEDKSSTMLEVIVENLTTLNESIMEIKQENEKLRERLANFEQSGSSTVLDARNAEIGRLTDEIQELKKQRTKATKEMEAIQKNINTLKMKGLSTDEISQLIPTNENQQPNTITLSFNLEDEADRMILGDF